MRASSRKVEVVLARGERGAHIWLGILASALVPGLLGGCAEKIVNSEPFITSAVPENGGESITAVYSLPKTVVGVSAKADPTTHQVSYIITPAILPDKGARFRLRYIPTHLSDDSVTFGVDQNGLLSSVVANSTGHQGDIIVALATLAASAVALGPVPAAPPVPVPGPAGACVPMLPFTMVYDLSELAQGVSLPDCSTMNVDWRPAAAPAVAPKPPECGFSICYRTLMPVKATISAAGQTMQLAFVAVDPEAVEGINFDSAPLVTRAHTITLSSGLMTSAVISDPSVALAVANLPLTVIKAILSAPATLLSLKVTNVQDETSLLQQQKALLDAQVALQADVAATRAPTPIAGSNAGP